MPDRVRRRGTQLWPRACARDSQRRILRRAITGRLWSVLDGIRIVRPGSCDLRG
jgi:hypothetical protein